MVVRLIVSVVLGFVANLGMSAGLVEVMDLSPLIANLSSSAMLTVICLGIAMIVPAIRRDPTPGFEELMKLMDNVDEWLRIKEHGNPTSNKLIAICRDNSTRVCSDGVVRFYNTHGRDCNASNIELKTSRSEQRQIRKKFKQLQAKLNDRDNRSVASELQKRLNHQYSVSVPGNTQALEQAALDCDILGTLYKEKQILIRLYDLAQKVEKPSIASKMSAINDKIILQLESMHKRKA